jgi:hypothetical protein
MVDDRPSFFLGEGRFKFVCKCKGKGKGVYITLSCPLFAVQVSPAVCLVRLGI